MPRPSDPSLIFRSTTHFSLTENFLIFALKDSKGKSTARTLDLRKYSHFFKGNDGNVYTTLTIDDEEQCIPLNSLDLQWYQDENGLWQVHYAPLAENSAQKAPVEKANPKGGHLHAASATSQGKQAEDQKAVEESVSQEAEDAVPFYSITNRKTYQFKNGIFELYVASPTKGRKHYVIIRPNSRSDEFVIKDNHVYGKVAVGKAQQPQLIPIDSPQLQWQYVEASGKKLWSCSTLPEYYTHYLPAGAKTTSRGHIEITLLLCNDYGEIHNSYTSETITLDRETIALSQQGHTVRLKGREFHLQSLLFKTTDGKNFEPIDSSLANNTDETHRQRAAFENELFKIIQKYREKMEAKEHSRSLTGWEQAQSENNLWLKALRLLGFLLAFLQSANRPWNYLRTPYFMPSLALKNITTVHNQWFEEDTFAFSIPSDDEEAPARAYPSLATYITYYHQQTQSKLLGRYHLPYFFGHSVWLLLSFIPLPFITAHEQRVALARDIKHIEHALTTTLENKAEDNGFLGLTGYKQQLNPWRLSANAPLSLQVANGLYRCALYGGTIAFTIMAILVLMALAASTLALPMATTGFVVATSAVCICFQEIFNPGSLTFALRKILNQITLPPSPGAQVLHSLKGLLLTSPLLLPLYGTYKAIPGTGSGKQTLEEYSGLPTKNPLLHAHAYFTPTGNIEDITFLRTLLNPFQLAQMTLTWLVLISFFITDTIARLFQAIPVLNGGLNAMNALFKSVLYGLYSVAFLILNPPKQLFAYGTHTIDSPVTACYAAIHTLNQPYTGNAYVQSVPNRGKATLILSPHAPQDESPTLFKDYFEKPTNKIYLRLRLHQLFSEASTKINGFRETVEAACS